MTRNLCYILDLYSFVELVSSELLGTETDSHSTNPKWRHRRQTEVRYLDK